MSNRVNPENVLADLMKDLDPSEVLTQASPDYAYHSAPFAAQRERHPSVVFAPESVSSLSRIVRELYQSGLDFNIRGHGFKSPSGDVLVSMIKFRNFSYDNQEKLATVGVGLTWIEVCEMMQRVDPEYTTLVARTASIGVGGCLSLGGYSWMSGELGCISDPANFLDAEVVKYDGSVVMASEEPDLMWALRGGGGGFGVMTKVILRAHPYTTNIWTGNILVPRSELPRVARGIADLMEHNQDPSVNGFLFLLNGKLLESMRGHGEQKEAYSEGDKVLVFAYDANGEEHGREAFRFALDAPGAMDNTKVTNVYGVVKMQENATSVRGKMKIDFQAVALARLGHDTIMKAAEWYDGLSSYGGSISASTYLVFEFKALGPIRGGTSKDCAYPRPANLKHILLIGTGCSANAPAEEWELSHKLNKDAPRAIFGKDQMLHFTPPGLEHFHDPKSAYGENLDKLVQVRRKYDPERRFKGAVSAA